MMKHLFALGLVGALLASSAVLAGSITSGPQIEEKLAGPFHPLNVTGENAGQKACLYCANGTNPVAMVFAREATPAVAKLIKELDNATLKNKDASMGSFVVFCSSDEKLEKNLKEMAGKQGLKEIVLSIDNPAGPKGYKVAKDADVTVVLYVDHTVKANHAFKAGELSDKDIATVVADVSKIVKK